MGQKTHPIGFRLGISKDWKSRYYAGRELPALLREDELLRKYLKARLGHAAIAACPRRALRYLRSSSSSRSCAGSSRPA